MEGGEGEKQQQKKVAHTYCFKYTHTSLQVQTLMHTTNVFNRKKIKGFLWKLVFLF